MGGIVRAVFPQLSLLRKRGYTLKMLVDVFEENGLRITATALSGYMKKLDRETEGASAMKFINGEHNLRHPVRKLANTWQ